VYALGSDHVEHVPVLGPTHCRSVFVLFPKQLNVESREEFIELFAFLERHVWLRSPAVVWPEKVSGENTPAPKRLPDGLPGTREFVRRAKRETETGVDKVRVRKLDLVETSDDGREPRRVFWRDRRSKSCDRLGSAVDGDNRPAVRQQREGLAAVSTTKVNRNPSTITTTRARKDRQSVQEQRAKRPTFNRLVVILPGNL